MQKFSNFKCDLYNNCKTVKSLFEVENFLKNLCYVKNSFCFVKKGKYILDKNKINIPDILNMTNYDNDSFKYVKTTKALMKNFKKFIGDLPLLIIDNSYTRNYLEEFDNKKESIFKYLNLDMSDDVFDRLVNKYNLEASNYLVDLLYEAIIKEI